jgi:hypothetical protein
MKTRLSKAAYIIVIAVAAKIALDMGHMEFGTVDFFQKHGILFLIFIALFPRLTLLFTSVASGGVFWWLGWVFCPRILVAGLATVAYFHTNPILVIISWIVAFGGEAAEKRGLGGRSRFVFKTYRGGPANPFQQEPQPASSPVFINKDDAIEAEFTKKS